MDNSYYINSDNQVHYKKYGDANNYDHDCNFNSRNTNGNDFAANANIIAKTNSGNYDNHYENISANKKDNFDNYITAIKHKKL